jgi:hypothetical protein
MYVQQPKKRSGSKNMSAVKPHTHTRDTALWHFFVVVVGLFSTAAMKAYCTLTPPNEFRHSPPEALHTKRRERPLSAKDGTKAKKGI